MTIVKAPPAPEPASKARRREIRMPVKLLGTLTPSSGDPACVQVTDLSRGGACCRVATALDRGEAVTLKLDGLEARGIVCWTSNGMAGLSFREPLRASQLLIQSSRSRCAPSPLRPARLAASGPWLRLGG